MLRFYPKADPATVAGGYASRQFAHERGVGVWLGPPGLSLPPSRALPFRRARQTHSITVGAPTPNRSAACRADVPAAVADSIRFRNSWL